MELVPHFLQAIAPFHVAGKVTKVLAAVSGGLDSVVLAHLCKKAGLNFTIVHVNFNLRGDESNRDEAFVRQLAATLEVPVLVQSFATEQYADDNKLSIQEAARTLRYAWFNEVRIRGGFSHTLLAHHANDNIETVLMNLCRGTGLDGLLGMPRHNPEAANCIRPLLAVPKTTIEAYARENALSWVEDSSNSSNKYTRNFFRNEVLPLIKTKYPGAEENISATMQRLEQTAVIYNDAVAVLKRKVCEKRGEEIYIPVLKLMAYQHSSLLYEILKDYGFGESAVDEFRKLAQSVSGKYIANQTHRIIRHGRWFIISPVAIQGSVTVIEKNNDFISFGGGLLHLKTQDVEKYKPGTDASLAQFDAAEVQYPLVVRPWKAGDYFYPLGMKKKKKLSRFFIDSKLSKSAKEKVWVIESHKKIMWVVGHRIDERFKITGTTKKVLSVTLKN